MKIRLLLASAALAAMTGFAAAQTADTSAPETQGTSPMTIPEQEGMTDMDRTWYGETGAMVGPLFTDETMAEPLSGDDFTAAFGGMTEEDQAGIREACDRALEDRGSYGPVTLSLCDQVGAI